MSASTLPALASSISDLIQHNVSDRSLVDPNAKQGCQERFIHREIYKKFPDISCVVYSHAEDVIPYAINGFQKLSCSGMSRDEFLSELGPIRFLNVEQASGAEKMSNNSAGRPWQL